MQAQDIIGKASCRQYAVSAIICYLVFTAYCVVFSAYYSYAEQPIQQKSLEEERLNIIRADIQKKIEQLEKLKMEVEEAKKALRKAHEEELLKIAKIYSAMPPEEAARKLEALNEDMAVLILTTIKPRTAGRIMAQMDKEKAAAISKKMLKRGSIVPEKTSW